MERKHRLFIDTDESKVAFDFSGDVYTENVKARITTQEVAELLGVDLTTLRRLMRNGTITAPPIIFDSGTNSTGRMWSEDDVQRARTALKGESVES